MSPTSSSSTRPYDVIVVGARCAGAATAMLLARAGHRVLALDRASFPSDTLSTHVVKIPGAACLKRWGLLDRVLEMAHCPPIRTIELNYGPFSLVGTPPPLDSVDADYSPRRYHLDLVLAEAALASGVEVREKFTVESIVQEGGRIVGIKGRGSDGVAVTERAAIVVGADGINSMVARAAGAEMRHEIPPSVGYYYSYWSNAPLDRAMICPRDGRVVIAFPTNDGATCVLIGWRHAEFGAFSADVEKNFAETLDLVPEWAEKIRQGNRQERFHGTPGRPSFFRKPWGPGWALVGDAGLHRDPITAQGISDAFRDSELLSHAIHLGLTNKLPLEEALAGYEQQRDAAAMPLYRLTAQLALLVPPPPEMMALIGALRGNQREIDQFVGTLIGTVSIPEFFAPPHVQSIMAAAATAPVRE